MYLRHSKNTKLRNCPRFSILGRKMLLGIWTYNRKIIKDGTNPNFVRKILLEFNFTTVFKDGTSIPVLYPNLRKIRWLRGSSVKRITKIIYKQNNQRPTQHVFVQSQQQKFSKKVWNMFKGNNKDTRTALLTSSWCLYCQIWTYVTPFSSVSIDDFE